MSEQDPYKEIVDELFIMGLSVYLDKQQIGKKIDDAIQQAVELAAPRKMVLTPRETCAVFAISRSTFDSWIDADDLPHLRRGSKVLVPIPALQQLLTCPAWFRNHGLEQAGVVKRFEEAQAG